jgi:hypothetical protein
MRPKNLSPLSVGRVLPDLVALTLVAVFLAELAGAIACVTWLAGALL